MNQQQKKKKNSPCLCLTVTGEKREERWAEGDDIAGALQLPGLHLCLKWVEQVIETLIWLKQPGAVRSVTSRMGNFNNRSHNSRTITATVTLPSPTIGLRMFFSIITLISKFSLSAVACENKSSSLNV